MSDEIEQPKPTLWQRIKGGVKGFFTSAIGYIPKGIMFTSVIMGGLYALESATGMGFGLVGMSAADLVSRGLLHLTVGSVISGAIGGGMGAYNPASVGIELAPAVTPGAPTKESENGLAQKLTQGIGEFAAKQADVAATDTIAPGAGTAMQTLQMLGKMANNASPSR